MKYVILGDPIALQRPRLGKYSIWDSQKSAKLVAGITVRNQHEDRPLYKAPIKIELTFYFPMPATSKKNRIHALDPYPHRPDADNCIKFILDVCNSILYDDDRFITEIICYKKYDTVPRTEFELWTI